MKLKIQIIIESDSGKQKWCGKWPSWNVALCGQMILG